MPSILLSIVFIVSVSLSILCSGRDCSAVYVRFGFCHASFNERTSLKLLFGNILTQCVLLLAHAFSQRTASVWCIKLAFLLWDKLHFLFTKMKITRIYLATLTEKKAKASNARERVSERARKKPGHYFSFVVVAEKK